jgi:hypothetical protein
LVSPDKGTLDDYFYIAPPPSVLSGSSSSSSSSGESTTHLHKERTVKVKRLPSSVNTSTVNNGSSVSSDVEKSKVHPGMSRARKFAWMSFGGAALLLAIAYGLPWATAVQMKPALPERKPGHAPPKIVWRNKPRGAR